MRSSFSSLCVLLLASASSTTAITTPLKRATSGAGGTGVGNGVVEDGTEIGNGLVVTLESSPSVGTADDISITATIENTGTQDAKILKYGSILDNERATKSFKIIHNAASSGGGNEVPFEGTRLQLSDDLPEDAYVTIPPGGKLTKTHSNLNGVYDFSALGPGRYQFEVLRQTYGSSLNSNSTSNSTSDSGPALKSFSSKFASSSTVEVEVTGNTTKRDLSETYKRDVLVCSKTAASAQISSSFSEALDLASLAVQYIQYYGASDELFRAYFGAQTTSIPLTVFSRVANENTDRQFFCSDPGRHCEDGVIAYTLVSTGDIYFCDPFYSEVATQRLCTDTSVAARNIRGATTLHELTHATSDTEDYKYGCAADRALASQSPAQAAGNADNYNCFATSVYALTQCSS